MQNAHDMATGQAELARTIPSRLRKVDLALPIYRGAGFSGWQVDLGARLINFFNKNQVRMNYRRWKNPAQSTHPFARHLGNQERLESIVAFDDLQFYWPERIALDALLNAEEQGAVVRNFTEVTELTRQSSGGWTIALKDVLPDGSTAEIHAKLVLNLTGAWIDEVAGKVRTSNAASQRVIGVKGVHLLVRLAPEGKQKLSDIKNQLGSPRRGVVEGFTDEELNQLRHLLLKLVRNMTASKELEKV